MEYTGCNLCGFTGSDSNEFSPINEIGFLCLPCLKRCLEIGCVVEDDVWVYVGKNFNDRIKHQRLERSKSGKPVYWESGGGYSNTGYAYLICNKDGMKKKPLFVKNSGHLACSEHALFIVDVGDVIVSVVRETETVFVDEVMNIFEDQMTLLRTHICEYGDWDRELPEKFIEVVSAGLEKSQTYHCRSAVYYEI